MGRLATSFFITLALSALQLSCRDRANAQGNRLYDAPPEAGGKSLACKVTGHHPSGTQVRGMTGRSKAAAIDGIAILVPPRETNDNATITFNAAAKDFEEMMKIDRQALDLYDRWGRLARVSGAVMNGDERVIAVTVWFNTVKADGTGFVQFEEGKADDLVKVDADLDCKI